MISLSDPVFQHDVDLDEEDDRVSQQVRGLLTRRGVAIHKQGSELSTFLGVARSTIHRKFKNGGWSAAELRAIAERWRGNVEELLGGGVESAGPAAQGAELSARIRIPGMPGTALLVVGPELDDADACDLVAVNPVGQWEVYQGGTEPPGSSRYSVRKLTFSALPRLKIALLEDDRLAADALADELVDLGGVVVHKFHRPEELISALKQRRYEAYVIDWLLGGGVTAESAILAVRELQKTAPIVVTTGAMALQADAEQQLIPFCERHRVGIIEKKFRAAVLLAHLRRDLAANKTNIR
jgi:hypothetical protein